MATSGEFLERANRALSEVLKAQEDFTLAEREFNHARDRRELAIVNAAAEGFTRRALAEATGLTNGRVQQIIARAHRQERPAILPALRMERERRERSQILAEAVRRSAARRGARNDNDNGGTHGA
jgi:hypothetical protein